MAKLKSAGKAGKTGGKAGVKPKLKQAQDTASRSIMDSAQQIWLAGMGAFSRAQQEGTKLFDALIKEGLTLEQKTRKIAGGRVDAVRDAVESRVGHVKDRANDTWDRLEKVFEDRVQRALNRLGVPGRDELQTLIERVEDLNRALRQIDAAPTKAPRKAAAKKAPAKAAKAVKPAAKPAEQPARKPAAKRAKPAPKAAAADAAPSSEA